MSCVCVYACLVCVHNERNKNEREKKSTEEEKIEMAKRAHVPAVFVWPMTGKAVTNPSHLCTLLVYTTQTNDVFILLGIMMGFDTNGIRHYGQGWEKIPN